MLTLQQIKANPEEVVARLAVKGFDGAEPIARVIALDDRRRQLQLENDNKAAELNRIAASIGALMKQGQKEEAAEARARHLDSTAQMECRKAVLAAKQDVIEEAFRLAHKKLLELPREQYVALLADLAVKASTTGREKLIFSAPDRAQVGKAVVMAANEKLAKAVSPKLPEEVAGSKVGAVLDKVVTGASAVLSGTGMLTLSEETRPMDGGFILSDGAVEVNCTFDTLIRLQRGALAGEVAKVLFD